MRNHRGRAVVTEGDSQFSKRNATAARQSKAQRKTVERVMDEYKEGDLRTARGTCKVKNPKQAIAVALSEAGASKFDTPRERARNLRRSKAKERTRDELYAEARRRDIHGRSTMNKAQLARALTR
jgi:hypothetical protein